MYLESVEAKWLDPAKQRVQVDRQMKDLMNLTKALRAECDHQRAEIRVLHTQIQKIDSMNLIGKVGELENELEIRMSEIETLKKQNQALAMHMGKLKKRMSERGIDTADD